MGLEYLMISVLSHPTFHPYKSQLCLGEKFRKSHEQSSDVFFAYLKCEGVGYWFIVVICQNQLTIFIHIRSATIADYTVINYLLQALVFLAKIGFHGIISGSKNSNLIFLDYKLLTHHMKRYLTGLFDILTLHSIRFSSIPLVDFI